MAKSISGKKHKKVFREGVIQIHGRFELNNDDEPVLITEGGASRGVKSVELVDPEVYRVTLNMPKATFLGAPVVTYINDYDVAGTIYRLPVVNIVSTPAYSADPNVVQNPNGILPSFDIVSTSFNNTIQPFANGGDGICSFTVTVSTSVVPNGMNPSVVQSPQTWLVTATYNEGDFVTYGTEYYVAVAGSTGVTPIYGMPSTWSKYTLDGATAWNATTTYVGGDVVLSGGNYYRALDVPGNLNKDPDVAVDWEDFWTRYLVLDNPYVARTAIGGTNIVHTPKLETFSVYGRFRGEPDLIWDSETSFRAGSTAKWDGKYWLSITDPNTGNEPQVGSAFWEEYFLVVSDDAKSEGIESVVRAGFSGLYPDLPENVYVVTLKTTSPIVQFLGAAAITQFQFTNDVAFPSFYDAKVFCEGVVLDSNGNNVYGTTANQIVLAFYDQAAIPEIVALSDGYVDQILLTLNYTTSKVF
jgi:hypothetical protein